MEDHIVPSAYNQPIAASTASALDYSAVHAQLSNDEKLSILQENMLCKIQLCLHLTVVDDMELSLAGWEERNQKCEGDDRQFLDGKF